MAEGTKLSVFPPIREIRNIRNARDELKLRGTDINGMSPVEAARVEELRETVRANIKSLGRIALLTVALGAVAAYFVFKQPQTATHPQTVASAQAPDADADAENFDWQQYYKTVSSHIEEIKQALKELNLGPEELIRQNRALKESGLMDGEAYEDNTLSIQKVEIPWLSVIQFAPPELKYLADFFVKHAKLALYEMRPDATGKHTEFSKGVELSDPKDFSYSSMAHMSDTDPNKQWFKKNKMPFFDLDSNTLYLPELTSEDVGDGLDKYIWAPLQTAYNHTIEPNTDTAEKTAVFEQIYTRQYPLAAALAGLFRANMDLFKKIQEATHGLTDEPDDQKSVVPPQEIVEKIGQIIDTASVQNPQLKNPQEKARTARFVIKYLTIKQYQGLLHMRYIAGALNQITQYPSLINFN